MEGTWHGTVAEMKVEAKIETDLDGVFQGVLTLGEPTCFNSGALSGSLSSTSVRMVAHGSGTTTQNTYVQISGELSDDTITGLFTMLGDMRACNIDKAAITLSR